ncbi:hypothetical protein KC316_g12458 [Hortaea werneckii]|nr:hypothetical protein KC324_g2275 [Hortaea werneckii]KAI7566852.1 hypothetical protein KC316_g12458 [Hortaea werneckii]
MRLTILLMPAVPPGGTVSTDSQNALWKCLFAGSEDDTLQDVWKRTERKLEKRSQSSRDSRALSNFRFGHLSDKNGAEYDLEDTLGSLFGQKEEETLFAQQPALNSPLKRPASSQLPDETPRKRQRKEPDWELTDAGREWTPEEDEDLICGKEEGLSCPAICKKYGIKRPDSSLRNRWRSVLSKRDEVRERLKMPPLRQKRKVHASRAVQKSQQGKETSETGVSAQKNEDVGDDSNVPHESAHENATPNLNDDSLKGQTKDVERERDPGNEPDLHIFVQATPENDNEEASTTEAQNAANSRTSNSQRTQRTVVHVAIPGPSKRPFLGEGRNKQSQLPFTPVTSRQPSRPSSHATEDRADHAFPTPPNATPNEHDNSIEKSGTHVVPSSGAETQDGTHMSYEGVDLDFPTDARAIVSGEEIVHEDNPVTEDQKAQATNSMTDDDHDPFEDFQRLASEAETPRPPTTGRLRRPTASLRRRRRRASSPIVQREIANNQSSFQTSERVEELGPSENFTPEYIDREPARPIPPQETPPEEPGFYDEHPSPTPIVVATQYSQPQLSSQRQLEMMGADDPDYELKKTDDQVMAEARIRYPDNEQQMMRDYCRKINWREISRLVRRAGECEGDEAQEAEINSRIKALNEEMARNQETWDIEDGKRPPRRKMQRLQQADVDAEESADEELERDEPQTERVREGIPGSIWSDIEDEDLSEDEDSVMAGFEVFGGGGETNGYDVLGFGEDRRPSAIEDDDEEAEEGAHFQMEGDNCLPRVHEDFDESDAGEEEAIQDEIASGAHEIAQRDDGVRFTGKDADDLADAGSVPQAIKIEDWQPENATTIREDLNFDVEVRDADRDFELPLTGTPMISRRLRSPFEVNRMVEGDVRPTCSPEVKALRQPQGLAPAVDYEFNAHISPADRPQSEADLPEYPPWYSAAHVDQEDANAGAVSDLMVENEQNFLPPSNIPSSSAKPHKSKSAEKKARYRQRLAARKRKRRQQLGCEELPTSELSIEESEMRKNQKAQKRKERKLEKKKRRQSALGLSSDAGVVAV